MKVNYCQLLNSKILFLLTIFFANSTYSQIEINMCPISKTPSDKKFNIEELTITNNTDVVLNTFSNEFTLEWPNLNQFSGVSAVDGSWTGKISVNYWPFEVVNGETSSSKSFNNNSYLGDYLTMPTSGLFTQDGITYDVTINHCLQSSAGQVYNPDFSFDRKKFIYSPTDHLCLGEAATEIWQGLGVRDVMIPEDKPSYAIGIMVTHQMFSNLINNNELLSPHFWWALALNETAMICEGTNFVARRRNHCYVNSADASCLTDGIGNNSSNSSADNCFQVLSYNSLAIYLPDLFYQTNRFGTATATNVVGGGNFETGLITAMYYQIQSLIQWDQFANIDAIKISEEAKDPYFLEKIFYHGFHDGNLAGTALLGQIYDNYETCVAADDMTPLVSGPSWSSNRMGSPKVANFTALLDGNGNPFPQEKTDSTIEYYGCYDETLSWDDVVHYFDEVKLLYPQLMNENAQEVIRTVFNGINGGNAVLFSQFGPIIDEIVIQMGGHNPWYHMYSQTSASEPDVTLPPEAALKISKLTCEGEAANLEVWLSGTAPFNIDIEFPDQTLQSFVGITSSPYSVEIDQLGAYRINSLQDANGAGKIKPHQSWATLQSKDSAVVSWDRTNYNQEKDCYDGSAKINKIGGATTVSYTLNSGGNQEISFNEWEHQKTIDTEIQDAQYIITGISPSVCSNYREDTIKFCSNEICSDPVLTEQPSEKVVCPGEPTNFYVETTAEHASYIWEISENNGLSWYEAGENTSGQGTNTLNILYAEKNLLLRVNVTSGDCSTQSTSTSLLLDCILKINSDETEISIYPNPATNTIDLGIRAEKIDIIDANGEVTLSKKQKRKINIENLPTGIYTVKLFKNNTWKTSRFVKN